MAARNWLRRNRKPTRSFNAKLGLLRLEEREVPAIISDPGFESFGLAVGQFKYQPTGTPWIYGVNAGISSNSSGFTSGNPNAPEGSTVAFLQSLGSVSQVITLAGGNYEIDFMAAQRGNVPSKQTMQVLVDGQLVTNFNNVSGSSFRELRTTSFRGTAGNHTITFQGTNLNGGDNTMFIDQVMIFPTSNLVDSGFEFPGLAPGTFKYQPTGAAWNYGFNTGITANSSGFTGGNPNAPEGSAAAFIQQTGAFNQAVTLTAGTYSLSFFAARRANWGTQPSFQVFVNGGLVGTYDSLTTAAWVPLTTSTFTVPSGDATITFQGTNIYAGDGTVFVDDVQLQFAQNRWNDSGFESAGILRGQFKYNSTATPWVFSGSTGLSANNSAFTNANPPAPQGSTVAFLQQTGNFSQIASLPQGTYEIGFQAAQRGNQRQTFQLFVDGVVVGTYNNLTGSTYQSLVSSSFTIASGNHTISFQGTNINGGDNTAFIDDVNLFFQPTTLTDSGFEQPVLSNGGFKYQPAGSPWTFGVNAGVTTNGSGFTSSNVATPQGNQVLFLQQLGSVSQVANFNGGTYQISFLAAQRRNVAAQQTFQVLVDGNVVTAFNNYTSFVYSELFTTTFNVGAGNHTITFKGTNLNGSDNTIFIDDVTVIQQTSDLLDSGFETPLVAPGAFLTTPSASAWGFSGSSGLTARSSGYSSGNPVSPQGSQSLYLQRLGSASQVVNFAEGTYGMVFYAAQRGNVPSVQTFQVLVDGVVFGTFNNVSGTSYSFWSPANFTVAAGNHTITFRGTNLQGGDNTIFIDDVIISKLS